MDARAASRPEHQVEVRRDVRVPVRDGLALSANLFLPAGPGRWPAILNMDPYRKDDWSAGWDLSLGQYLAERGFGYCRLDVRGTGSSPGIATDEYAAAETLDGHDAVEWLAARSWCTGRVGMWGLSYGGFTSLQVAATRPPHLRAIVPIQASDDRYTDDVHYVGGAMTVSDLAQYAVSQVAMNALPPLPSAWGEGWQERWLERLEATPVWLFGWARAQRDGPAWRRGSIATDHGAITAAILQLGGWMDEYVDAALRIQALATNAAARRTIVGPWVHGLPDHAHPGPNLDWLRELVRWFDRWLKDVDNGADAEAALTWFQRDPTPPERFPARLEGSWRATSADIGAAGVATEASGGPEPDRMVLALDGGEVPGRGRLVATAPSHRGVDTLDHHPTAGIRGGSLCWGAGHPPNGLAADLRLEEAAGPIYVSAPLDAPVEILGRPQVTLAITSTEPVAHVVVRLGCVLPDGAVEQVSEGILNLTHRASHAEPTALEPGREYQVTVSLRAAGYRFPPGHRIWLGLASAHWPVIWPSPGPAQLSIRRGPDGPSRLELSLAPTIDSAPVPAFATEPPHLRQFGSETAEPSTWEVVDDGASGQVTVRTFEAGTSELPIDGATLFLSEALTMTASEREPGAGRFENACRYTLDRGGIRVEVVADGTTIADREAFDMEVGLSVDVDGRRFFERRSRESIPRDLL